MAALLGLQLMPVFGVHRVEVLGAHHLTIPEVVELAGLKTPTSVFQVDPAGVEGRLRESPWVRTVSVRPGLPDRVRIDLEEWQPVATYHAGQGRAWYLSDQAVALGPVVEGTGGPQGRAAATPATLLDIQGPADNQPRAGQQAMDVRLLVALVNIQKALPGLIGQPVQAFQLDSCGDLTMVAGRGWRAQFGRVLTPEEFASLRDKVAALRALALARAVDFDSPDLDYVNLMNPSTPAVGLRSARPAPPPAAALGRAPVPAASAPLGPVVAGPPCR